MKKLLRLVIVAVIGLGVLGYFRGWFSVSSSQDADTAKVGVSVDKGKIRDDAAKAETRVKELKDSRTRSD